MYSIVIPTYNSVNHITETFKELNRFAMANLICYEIIIVNDGSIDSTEKTLQEIKNNNTCLKVYSLEQNRGQQFATAYGILKTTGNYVITIDDDLEYTINPILNYLHTTSDLTYFYANKYKKLKFMHSLYTLLSLKIIGFKISSFRLIKRRAINFNAIQSKINDKYFFLDKILIQNSQSIMSHSVCYKEKKTSRYSLLRIITEYVKHLYQLIFSKK